MRLSLSTVPRLSWLNCRLWGGKRRCGEGGRCRQLDSLTRHLDDSLLCGIVRGSFQETAPRDWREHCKISRSVCWFGGSRPPRWRWKFAGRNNTNCHFCFMYHFTQFLTYYPHTKGDGTLCFHPSVDIHADTVHFDRWALTGLEVQWIDGYDLISSITANILCREAEILRWGYVRMFP